jgi:hypothetical protein
MENTSSHLDSIVGDHTFNSTVDSLSAADEKTQRNTA